MKYLIIILILAAGSLHAQDSLTIEQAINRVLEHNYGIQIMKSNTEIAENNNNPGAAGYLPTIDATANQDFTINSARLEFINGDLNEANNAQNRAFDIGARLEWTIFDGFKMFATDKKLDELQMLSETNLRGEMEMKVYQTSVNFYTLLSLQSMQDVYEKAIDLSQMRLDYLQDQYDAGAANKVQLIQARLDLNADSAAYIDNQQALTEVRTTLNGLLVYPVDQETSVKGDLNETFDLIPWEKLRKKFKEQNTTVLLAKRNMAVAELETKEAKSRFYPQLSLYSSYNFGNSVNEVGFLASRRSFGPSFGVSAQWSILDHLSRSTELKNARIAEDQAQITYQQDSLQGMTDLRNYYNMLQFAQRKVTFEQENIEQTQSILGITKEALKAGSITPLEVREVQQSVVEARRRLIQAYIDYRTAQMNVSLLTGVFAN
ncbi:MAG: TolC family protein [Bacteroidota bacterium]